MDGLHEFVENHFFSSQKSADHLFKVSKVEDSDSDAVKADVCNVRLLSNIASFVNGKCLHHAIISYIQCTECYAILMNVIPPF